MIVPNSILLAEVSALVKEGKEVELLTKGCSMLPFIVGDRDSVRLRSEAVAVGDAVLAEIAPGRYVLHRIISLDGDKVVLKGDGNLTGTENCRRADVQARAVAVIRAGNKETDCTTGSYMRRVRFWNSLPYLMRRVWLAILRRTICRLSKVSS